MRRPQKSLMTRRQQRSYVSHTNTSGTSESAAVCEKLLIDDMSTITAVKWKYGIVYCMAWYSDIYLL